MRRASLLALLLAACSSHSHDAADDLSAVTDASDDARGSLPDGGVSGDGSVEPCTPTNGKGATIISASSPVLPGQTALLFGANVGATATVIGARFEDGEPGTPPRPAACLPQSETSLSVLQASDLSVKVSIPSAWQPGVYALVVQNSAGESAPVVLNRPRVDWLRSGPGGVITSGGSVDVYGRSFGTMASAWLVNASGDATALGSAKSDGYLATFAVPTLAAGSYQLYVHSGFGGPWGFSDPFAVTVAAAVAWPTTAIAIAAGSGNDDKAFSDAFATAMKGGGGVISVATGSYTLTAGLVIPPNTVLKSASGKRGDVKITFNEAQIPFPYGFAGDGNFVIQSLTISSSTSARLIQCPNQANYMRDPEAGGPQYQPGPYCENATLHDVSLTMTTLRDRVENNVQTTTPSGTDMVVINGSDCEISDSTLVNSGGSSISLAQMNHFNLLRNILQAGDTRISPTASEPLDNSIPGGGAVLYDARNSALVGNTVTNAPNAGGNATMGIEYRANDLYIADNITGPNLSNYGEGFSFDAPYYPDFIGKPSAFTANSVTIPRVLNAANNSVYAVGTFVKDDPTWTEWELIVVNGTGLGQFAIVAGNDATAADGSTLVQLDRSFKIPLDKTSVVAIVEPKYNVVFARNAFSDVAVGAQLYAGGYDFIIDGSKGETMEGTYCYANDFMSQRASATDLQRRFSACYFVQWLNTALTNKVDASYPWAEGSAGPGVSTPYNGNGLIGVHSAPGATVIPSDRGLGAVGVIIRSNQVADFAVGLIYSGGGGQLPNPVPLMGRDNIIELNQTASVPIGYIVEAEYPQTLLRQNTCTTGCTTTTQNQTDGGM